MKIWDISVPISNLLPIWPGDPEVTTSPALQISKGDPANVSHLSFGSHTGTHVDAPYHFEPDGTTIDLLPLDLLIGEAMVVELPVEEKIDRPDLETLSLSNISRILFKTKNSQLWQAKEFSRDFIALTREAALYLVEQGIKLVGVDYLSVESFSTKDFATHHTFLRHGVALLEGLNLTDVPPGIYELICLPLKIKGGDGAPARAILREKIERVEPQAETLHRHWI